jgi:hypothetical protein
MDFSKAPVKNVKSEPITFSVLSAETSERPVCLNDSLSSVKSSELKRTRDEKSPFEPLMKKRVDAKTPRVVRSNVEALKQDNAKPMIKIKLAFPAAARIKKKSSVDKSLPRNPVSKRSNQSKQESSLQIPPAKIYLNAPVQNKCRTEQKFESKDQREIALGSL